MWINTKDFIKLAEKVADAQGAASALKNELDKRDVTIDWLRTRVNQLEKERALLMRERTGLNIPIPEIAPAQQVTGSRMSGIMAIDDLFEDIGDAEARKQGILHDENGELVTT
jgi:hypothetical protein